MSQLLESSYNQLLQTNITLLFRTALTWAIIKDEILFLSCLCPNLCTHSRFEVYIVNSFFFHVNTNHRLRLSQCMTRLWLHCYFPMEKTCRINENKILVS